MSEDPAPIAGTVATKSVESLTGRKILQPALDTVILVCVSRPGVSEDLIRRGCRIAHRTQGELLVLHVATSHQGPDAQWIDQLQHLVQDLGGQFKVRGRE
jgi:K+-sensing histidine kinase KdpD